MEIDINQLMSGKATRIKGKDYFSTEQYVTPFLEKMSKYTDDFRVQVKLPEQISITKKEDLNLEDTIFNRVWIQAVLKDNIGFENHVRVVGLVYGLDTRKPVSKLYTGGLNCACTNLCIFNPSDLTIQELDPETPIDYRTVEPMIERELDVVKWLKKLSNIEVPYNEVKINEALGRWVRNSLNISWSSSCGRVKLAASTAIDAYKLLYEKRESPYYVAPGLSTTMFNIYNAWTQLITDDNKDVINHPDKTLLVKQILGIN